MKKILLILICIPFVSRAQFVKQGVCTQSGDIFTLNGISQTPYAGRFFNTVPVNLNNNFDLTFTTYLGNVFNNGAAFLFIPGTTAPTASYPPTVINTDNIHNFGTGSITTNFVIEFDIRGSFCAAGQNTSYEPTSDINHVSYWRNNSSCTFGNYYSPYSALGTVNYYAYEPYRIKWTKATNTLETYYNNVLIKSNVVDLVGLLGSTAYWGFSAGCYCVTGGPSVKDMFLNGVRLLPFSIRSFTAEKNNLGVELKWQTAQEQNGSHFMVEKSIDGTNFSSLQRVAAVGNSSTPQNYTAIDNKPFYGTNFYRFKMVDIDGKYSYSEIVAIKIDNSNNGITLFPVPAENEIHLQIPSSKKETCIIRVLDMRGGLVTQQTVQLNNALFSTTLNIRDIARGVYQLVVQHGDQKETRKFIKQ